MSSTKGPLGRPVALGAGRRMSVATLVALAGVVLTGASALGQEKGQPSNPPADGGLSLPQGVGGRAGLDRKQVKEAPVAIEVPGKDAKALTAAGEAASEAPSLVVGEDDVNLSAFSEPVQLSALVSMLADSLGINIAIKGDVPGTVVFNAPVTVKKEEFLALVDALLEQQGYTITTGAAGFYNVVPVSEVAMNFKSERPSTRVIATPNLKPSALAQAITSQTQGQATLAAGGITYLDDLGVIIVTGTQRKLELVDSLVKQILAECAKQEYLRIELSHVAAPVARQRALELIGAARSVSPAMANVQGGGGGQVTSVPTLDNLADRLSIDPQGNALIFKGVAAEIEHIRRLAVIIDTKSQLQFKRYEVGGAAMQVADLARNRGLGEVTAIEATTASGRGSSRAANLQVGASSPQVSQQTTTMGGGPTMIVDDARGQILYYATDSQHLLMDSLIKELDIQAEEIVIRTYKVRHSKADEVADLILAVLNNESPSAATSSLLPQQSRGSRRSDSFGANAASRREQNQSGSMGASRSASGSTGELSIDGQDVFVVADVKNNQIMVKAAMKQQKDFARLIEKLDLRRPSVYIEATIVSVTWDDTMRLAFETQLINASGKGGLLQTNFGLSSPATGASILDRKVVNPGMSGITSALLQSDYVPIIVNALQTEADAKVLSKPQLLVDDNEFAEIVSLQEQATATTSTTTGNTGTTGGFGGYVTAGTTLNVTPQIAGGGYLRLEYMVELSSFTGEATSVGNIPLPPPKITNTVESASVTVPSDYTVVVGGLTVDSKNKTIAKVPFFGDIPLVGLLFQNRSTGERKTTLYVFLTPRIVRDPADIRLLSLQPKLDVGLPEEGLELRPTLIESSLPHSMK
jgi:type II secretory pathway component GspD/PulD (secretin)